jgi:hypothetical protein
MRFGVNRSIDPNVTVCPNYGPNKGRTALMLAAQVCTTTALYNCAKCIDVLQLVCQTVLQCTTCNSYCSAI